jgi:hypothetical protein
LGGALWDATGIPAVAFAAGGLSACVILGAGLTLRPGHDRGNAAAPPTRTPEGRGG